MNMKISYQKNIGLFFIITGLLVIVGLPFSPYLRPTQEFLTGITSINFLRLLILLMIIFSVMQIYIGLKLLKRVEGYWLKGIYFLLISSIIQTPISYFTFIQKPTLKGWIIGISLELVFIILLYAGRKEKLELSTK